MATGVTFSLGLARPPSPHAPKDTPSNTAQKSGNKRSHSALDDYSDDEATPAKQAVTHFDSNKGAFNSAAKPTKEKAPLIIQAQANRDWRDASKAAQSQRRARYGLPTQGKKEEAKNREEELKRLEDSNKPIFGLNVKSKTEEVAEETKAQPENDVADTTSDEQKKPRTDEERALDALLGIKQQSDLTIPAVTEEEAFERDYRDAPPMATLEQYAAVPVEEFGAALLRGMGWKEGHGIGSQSGRKIQKAKVLERRPALLGIGAKEDAGTREELGAWGRGSKKGKPEQVYNPVIMRNKKTGEEVTEEEMQAKMEKQQMRDKNAELDAVTSKRSDDGRDHRRKEDRSRRDDYSDEEYERRRRERKRREREKEEDRKYGYRSKDREETGSRGHSDYRRDKDRTKDGERRSDDRRSTTDDRDRRHRHDRGRDYDYDYDRRNRH